MKRTSQQIKSDCYLIEQSYFLYNKNNPLSILDVCCGTGDILSSLSDKMQLQGKGIDYSHDYVQESLKHKNINVFKDDAFYLNNWKNLNNQTGFDFVYNWYSSFFYFSREKNKTMFENSFNSLNENGVFIIEAYNAYNVIANFKEEFNYSKQYHGNTIKISRKCSIDISQRTLVQKWEFFMNGETKTHLTHSFLYFPDEVMEIIKSSGFKCANIFGVDKEVRKTFHMKDKRWIITAQK